jgi:iron(II)-dependent oxidoreductase
MHPGADLASALRDARARTLALVADLDDAQLLGPRLDIVNPLRWEIAHVAWFHEKWVLRGCAGDPPILPNGDALYDSSTVAHDTRWDLPLPDRAATLAYLAEVLDRLLARAARGPGDEERYFLRLGILHEDMHDEAFTYTRQTHGWPAPPIASNPPSDPSAGPLSGDAEIPGGTFSLGSSPDEPFVFDNEKWAHPVEVAPFAIARAAVTQAELAAFVDDGGYREPRLWTAEGWAWRERASALHPLYWRRTDGGAWLRRVYDREVPLEPHRPAVHVNCHEAEAFCRWAGRRLPTDLEWEVAAAGEREGMGFANRKRRFPWGDAPPDPARAHLHWPAGDTLDVAALPAGDSAFGCRQMIGNVWEWTATPFAPYPGFVVDPYQDYSRPWFHTHRVLRGGCFATAPRLIRNTWRNFYPPDRRDVFAGFRTCQC